MNDCSMSFNAFNLDKWNKCMCSDFHTQFEIILEKMHKYCINVAETVYCPAGRKATLQNPKYKRRLDTTGQRAADTMAILVGQMLQFSSSAVFC